MVEWPRQSVRFGGRTALHVAAAKGDVGIVLQLLMDEVSCIDINQLDCQGWTALHCACEAGHIEVCDLLLQNGADPSIPTNEGNIALHYIVDRVRPCIYPEDHERSDEEEVNSRLS